LEKQILISIIIICAVVFSLAAFLTREFFIALDPITSLHLGICNAPLTVMRAEKLAAALRRVHEAFKTDPANLQEYKLRHYTEDDPFAGADSRNRVCLLQRRRTAFGCAITTAATAATARTNSASIVTSKDDAYGNKDEGVFQTENYQKQYEDESDGIGDPIASFNLRAIQMQRQKQQKNVTVVTNPLNRDTEREETCATASITTTVIGTTPGTSPPHTGTGIARGTRVPSMPELQEPPSLREVFLGPGALLLVRGAGQRLSQAQCEDAYRKLQAQGCVDTAHLLQLFRMHLVPGPLEQESEQEPEPEHWKGGTNDEGKLKKMGKKRTQDNRCLSLAGCLDMSVRLIGIPVFPALEIVEYFRPYL
jgi:hypothetical protein